MLGSLTWWAVAPNHLGVVGEQLVQQQDLSQLHAWGQCEPYAHSAAQCASWNRDESLSSLVINDHELVLSFSLYDLMIV